MIASSAEAARTPVPQNERIFLMVALSSLSDELGPRGFLRYVGERAYEGGDSDDADDDLGWEYPHSDFYF